MSSKTMLPINTLFGSSWEIQGCSAIPLRQTTVASGKECEGLGLPIVYVCSNWISSTPSRDTIHEAHQMIPVDPATLGSRLTSLSEITVLTNKRCLGELSFPPLAYKLHSRPVLLIAIVPSLEHSGTQYVLNKHCVDCMHKLI